MAVATIGEYRDAVETAKGRVTTQKVDFTSGEAASVAFNANTRRIRVLSDTACHFVLGDGVAADTDDEFMAAEATEYFSVEQGRGHVISFIQRS